MTHSTITPNIIGVKSAKSTSDELKQLNANQELPNFTVLIAEDQSAGKGQIGNKWESEAGKNLTFSILLYPKKIEILNQFILSKMVSVAILQALEQEVGGLSIKWPNDIYLGDRKICGILIENSIMGATLNQTVIGIGININQLHFLSDAPNPISLAVKTGKEHSLEPIFNSVLEQIAIRFAQVDSGCVKTINTIYFDKLYRKDGYHKYKDDSGEFLAKITDVLDHGFMVLTLKDGTSREYAFKEVQFVSEQETPARL